MTCLISLKQNNKIYFGTDSCIKINESILISKQKNIFIKSNMLIGTLGDNRTSNIIQNLFDIPEHKSLTNKKTGFSTKESEISEISDIKYLSTTFVSSLQNLLEKYNKLTAEHCSKINLLIGYNGNTYTMHPDFSIIEEDNMYSAMGPAEDIILGSLYSTENIKDPEKRITIALKAAQQHNSTVREPFNILEL